MVAYSCVQNETLATKLHEAVCRLRHSCFLCKPLCVHKSAVFCNFVMDENKEPTWNFMLNLGSLQQQLWTCFDNGKIVRILTLNQDIKDSLATFGRKYISARFSSKQFNITPIDFLLRRIHEKGIKIQERYYFFIASPWKFILFANLVLISNCGLRRSKELDLKTKSWSVSARNSLFNLQYVNSWESGIFMIQRCCSATQLVGWQ